MRQVHVVFALREQDGTHQSRIHRFAGLLQSYRKAQILLPVGEVFDLALLRPGDYHDLRRLFAVYLCGRLYLAAVAQMYRVAVYVKHDLNRRVFLEIRLDIDFRMIICAGIFSVVYLRVVNYFVSGFFEHLCNFVADAHHVSAFVLSASGVAVSVESAVEHFIALGSVRVENEHGGLRFVDGFQIDRLVQNFFYVY